MKKMKRTVCLLALGAVFSLCANTAYAQAVKTNLPLILAGTPNVGVEFSLSQQFSINGDILWAPYMFKKNEEVFRALIMSADLRYYVKPHYYYTNDMFDGFYVGPYVMYGNFNIGLKNSDESKESFRRKGWGVSAGASVGYKFYLSKRFRLDLNLGLGFTHMQYNKYYLGGEWADYPLAYKNTRMWIGPTKFGVHLVYNLFR